MSESARRKVHIWLAIFFAVQIPIALALQLTQPDLFDQVWKTYLIFLSLYAIVSTQPVVLQRPTGETQDSIGEPTITYAERTTVMYLQPRSGREAMQDRNTPIGDWAGVGRIDVDFTSWSRVLYAGHVLDIVAPPRLVHNPSRNSPSHYSIDLQEVDAPDAVVMTLLRGAFSHDFSDAFYGGIPDI